MLNASNFWLTTVPAHQRAETALPSRVDIAVTGGGYSGLSAALTLARAGARVAVLEGQTMGWGASSRNAGMVLTGMKLGAEALVARYGRERARRLFTLSLSAIDMVERLAREEGIDCAFSRCGNVELAWKRAHFDGYAASAEFLQKEFGHVVRVVTRADLPSEIGSGLYHGGLVDEASAGLNPAQFAKGLAEAASRAGAGMHEQTTVTRIDGRQGGFVLHTNRGTLAADRVFVGTGGYTAAATPGLLRRVIPIGSYIIVTSPLPDDLAREVSPRQRMMFDSKCFLYYFRLTPDHRLLFGGRAAFTPETPRSTRRSAEILRKGMTEVFPQLRDVPVEYVWAGNVDFTYDMMPHAGVLDGLHYAVGYGGHGVAIATHLGDVVARQMLGEPVENPFDGLPFPRVPFYRGNPVLHLPLACAYHKVLDWLT